MQRYLINHLSAGEFILVLIIALVSLALLTLYLVRRYFSFLIRYENNSYLSFFLASITANYGIVLGFIIITLWQELDKVELIVMQESEQLSLLIYNALAFPVNVQDRIANGINEYIQVIINDEWPLMRWGKASEKAIPALKKLFHIIQSYSPETNIETTFYKQIVVSLNSVVEYRRERLEYIGSSLVDVLRIMLFLGIFIIILLISLIKSHSHRLQIFAVILVSTVLSFNLGLALLLDYPLSGSISASPAPFTKGILSNFNPGNNTKSDSW